MGGGGAARCGNARGRARRRAPAACAGVSSRDDEHASPCRPACSFAPGQRGHHPAARRPRRRRRAPAAARRRAPARRAAVSRLASYQAPLGARRRRRSRPRAGRPARRRRAAPDAREDRGLARAAAARPPDRDLARSRARAARAPSRAGGAPPRRPADARSAGLELFAEDARAGPSAIPADAEMPAQQRARLERPRSAGAGASRAAGRRAGRGPRVGARGAGAAAPATPSPNPSPRAPRAPPAPRAPAGPRRWRDSSPLRADERHQAGQAARAHRPRAAGLGEAQVGVEAARELDDERRGTGVQSDLVEDRDTRLRAASSAAGSASATPAPSAPGIAELRRLHLERRRRLGSHLLERRAATRRSAAAATAPSTSGASLSSTRPSRRPAARPPSPRSSARCRGPSARARRRRTSPARSPRARARRRCRSSRPRIPPAASMPHLLAAHLARQLDHALGQRRAVRDDDEPDHQMASR